MSCLLDFCISVWRKLHLSQAEVWLMPFGLLLDLFECHKQYHGMAKAKVERTIDDVIPSGI